MNDGPQARRILGVSIDARAIELIKAHLISAYPREGCGMLVGGFGGVALVTRAVGARNAETVRGEDRFTIDPRDMLALEKQLLADARQSPQGVAVERIIGFFHSHPDSPARPSRTDLEMALGAYEVAREFYVYLIAGVERGVVTDVTCWQLNPALSGFEEMRIYGNVMHEIEIP